MKIITMKPPHIAMVLLMIAFAVQLFVPGANVILWPIPMLGILWFGLGFALMIWAFKWFRKKQTVLHPTEKPLVLVTEGPYRFSRNPMYLGITLMLLGIGFVVGTLPLFVAPFIFFFIVNSVFVPYEEKAMAAVFAEAYLDYKKRVRRWL